MHILKKWWLLASADERSAMARAVGSTARYLYYLANPGASYGRKASDELAARVEVAAAAAKKCNPQLPALYRTDLSEVCRDCPYAKRCLKERAAAAHFDVADE